MENILKLKARHFKTITVTGTMSAGKSTLINAIVGDRVAETRNTSCTGEISCYIEKCNKLKELNNLPQCSIHEMSHKQDDLPWMIIDTPGINSSTDPLHKEITQKFLREFHSDVLIYVLNGSHLGADDDYQHLSFIVNQAKSQPIIFVLNKIDQYRPPEDSITNSIYSARQYLEEIGFVNPQIFPVAAYFAYLTKKRNFLKSLSFEESDELEYLIKKFQSEKLQGLGYFFEESIQMAHDSNQFLLRLSGINQLEGYIQEKVIKKKKKVYLIFNALTKGYRLFINDKEVDENSSDHFNGISIDEWIGQLTTNFNEQLDEIHINYVVNKIDKEEIELRRKLIKTQGMNIQFTYYLNADFQGIESNLQKINHLLDGEALKELIGIEILTSFESVIKRLTHSARFEDTLKEKEIHSVREILNAYLSTTPHLFTEEEVTGVEYHCFLIMNRDFEIEAIQQLIVYCKKLLEYIQQLGHYRTFTSQSNTNVQNEIRIFTSLLKQCLEQLTCIINS